MELVLDKRDCETCVLESVLWLASAVKLCLQRISSRWYMRRSDVHTTAGATVDEVWDVIRVFVVG